MSSVTADDTAAGAGGPYAGIRVVEIADDPGGEMLGMHLVNMGADVVKVEPPGGAGSRRCGPFADGFRDPDHSLPFWYYNGGKRSVVVDLESGLGELEALVADTDVLVSSLHPAELRRLGLDLAALAGRHPALIVVSVTPFGLTGPWAEYLSSDLVGFAASGLLITTGYDDHSIPPIRPGGGQAFHTAASFAHSATAMALLNRDFTGQGGLIDVSMHESAAITVELANMYWHYPRVLVQRQTCRHAQPVPTQPALFETADGKYVYLLLILADRKPWRSLVEWLDSEGLAVDLTEPEYDDLTHRQANFAHIQGVLEVFFLLKEAEVAFQEGQARMLPIGVLRAPEDLFDDEHLADRGFFAEVDFPDVPGVRRPVTPFRMSSWPSSVPRPAPLLGEHSGEILGDVAGSGR